MNFMQPSKGRMLSRRFFRCQTTNERVTIPTMRDIVSRGSKRHDSVGPILVFWPLTLK
jgi:hypothetical protein